MVLPVGEMGHEMPVNEDIVLAALKDGLPAKEGVYHVPGLAPDQYADAAATAAYSAKATANPNAVIFYQPVGRDGMAMGPQMGKEFATNFVSALLAAWILALAPFGFGKRVVIATVLGLFAWLVISVPYWNWYRFAADFTPGQPDRYRGGLVPGRPADGLVAEPQGAISPRQPAWAVHGGPGAGAGASLL
ncbi:hypothetical protein [Arenimonas daejeonensis]|uniref:hypothetical protein n=1 Tax=Arenimonas daejeonensis TaxID=370777 RepID=UPI0013155AE0|nr:hypothetical protein [Arenimonas daejeonensis]